MQEMQPIQNMFAKIQPGTRLFFETPEMRNKFIQGATVLKVVEPEDRLIVETQGKQRALEAGTLISLEA